MMGRASIEPIGHGVMKVTKKDEAQMAHVPVSSPDDLVTLLEMARSVLRPQRLRFIADGFFGDMTVTFVLLENEYRDSITFWHPKIENGHFTFLTHGLTSEKVVQEFIEKISPT